MTKGERLVAITFIQSRIQDPFRRNMLFELNEVAALEGLKMDAGEFRPASARPAEPAALLERQALTGRQQIAPLAGDSFKKLPSAARIFVEFHFRTAPQREDTQAQRISFEQR